MAFIHGTATWQSAAMLDQARDAIAMAEVLASQPWAQPRMLEVPGGSAAAVFVAQRRADECRPLSAPAPTSVCTRLRTSAWTTLASSSRRCRSRGTHRTSSWSSAPTFAGERRARLGCAVTACSRCGMSVGVASCAGVTSPEPDRSTTPHRLDSTSCSPATFGLCRRIPSCGDEIDLAYARSLIEHGQSVPAPNTNAVLGRQEAARRLPAHRRRHRLSRDLVLGSESALGRRHPADLDYVEELRELLEHAVRCRLPGAGHQAAAHLSGGLDSTSVAVTADRLCRADGQRVDGISWAPPRSLLDPVPLDERDLTEAAAAFGDVRLEYSTPSAADIADVETSDLATRPMTTLQVELSASRRAVERGVRTILSGWGGDELAVYNGKGYFASLARRGRFPTLWREMSLRSEIHDSSRLSEIRAASSCRCSQIGSPSSSNRDCARSPVVWPAYLHRTQLLRWRLSNRSTPVAS